MEKRGVKKRTKNPTIAELSRLKRELQRVTEQLESRERELAEATEQQIATSEILRVIASSPTEIPPVLNVIGENGECICGMPDVAIFRVEDDGYRVVATYGSAPVRAVGEIRPLD